MDVSIRQVVQVVLPPGTLKRVSDVLIEQVAMSRSIVKKT